MPTFRSLSVSILVDGNPLPEYQTLYDKVTQEARCFIPSCAGKEFVVKVTNLTQSVYMKASLKMDGHNATAQRILPKHNVRFGGCHPSPTTFRPFMFASGKLVDDEELPAEAGNVARLGEITITVYDGKLTKAAREETNPQPTNPKPNIPQPNDPPSQTINAQPKRGHEIHIPETQVIPERNKKGLEQFISLGVVKERKLIAGAAARASNSKTRRVFQKTKPRAKIIFQYRSLAFLQAKGIAPPDPVKTNDSGEPLRKRTRIEETPEPVAGPSTARDASSQQEVLEHAADDSGDKDEDIKTLLILKAQIDELLAKKRVSAKKKVKKEPEPVLAKGEIIDLTDL